MSSQAAEILIIDDDPSIRELVSRFLEKEGFTALNASTGEEGIAMSIRHRPALILCDYTLPGIDGLEVCEALRDRQDLESSYFILLTASGDMDSKVAAFDRGVDDFITKPFDFRELRSRIKAGMRIFLLNEALRRRQAIMDFDLNQAREYVRSQIPGPMKNHRVWIDYVYRPSHTLGGDMFHFDWIDDCLRMFVLDVSGHGIGSSLLSVAAHQLLAGGRLEANPLEPVEVLQELNRAFPMEKQNRLFFTIWYGIYDFKKRTLSYSSAGHPQGFLKESSGDSHVLMKGGIPIGMVKDYRYRYNHLELKNPFVICLFTDGLYEDESIPPDFNGSLDSFHKLLGRIPDKTSAPSVWGGTVLQWLYTEARCLSPREDDLTLIVAEIDQEDRSGS
ncbi:MAG TPA: regulator [Leptospiraceae bacterium]|nr:regulator [Spirochaetaceae bacterium]HBS06591.1 regulator [Leptospiraceae bacterium]|tara:strand:+ start:75518 stop:76687 length:1170 start_codon:yes stop_codon:yes gene_type:complete